MKIETIAAIATPKGRGGIGIIRVSGPYAKQASELILKKTPKPRQAEYLPFYDKDDSVIDQGIALFFPGPNSFTGDDVLELQGHGGPIILDYLLQRIVTLDIRLAKPGEFSERAFLNDKLDLAQAEAIADLINASSLQAARSAQRSLQGDFSKTIHELVEAITFLRVYVEAAIDFPEEEIDFLSEGNVSEQLSQLIDKTDEILNTAQQGVLLQEGMTLVIAGKPNAGKSSLLNYLSGRESAIVTDIPGTTRDIIREQINLDGMPLHLIDTAGLRESDDPVEQEGIKRAWQAIEKADQVLLVYDVNTESNEQLNKALQPFRQHVDNKITLVCNKIDIKGQQPGVVEFDNLMQINLSAKQGEGMSLLRDHLKQLVGFETTTEGAFSARRRHIDSLQKAKAIMEKGGQQLQQHKAGELLAEDLRQAQNFLSEITGEFSSDDLLGEIFSSFCIGK